MESSSASRLSLSLKSEGYEDFTLTPDEPRIIRNCELEDFSLTPEASMSEAPLDGTAADDTCADFHLHETHRADAAVRPPIGEISETLSNNDVLEIVDKFLTNERLLQENLNIIPIMRTSASPLISPIDSDASLTNILVAKQTGTLFNSQNSSSKSTLDGTMDLEKFHYDDNYETDSDLEAGKHTFDPTEANDTAPRCASSQPDLPIGQLQGDAQLSARGANASRIPTRYSMQKLEPYYFADDEADGRKGKATADTTKRTHKVATTVATDNISEKAQTTERTDKTDKTDKTNKTDKLSKAGKGEKADKADRHEKPDKRDKEEKKQKKEKKGNTDNCGPRDYCAIVEPEPATFGKKKFFSLLRRKKSQSLESVTKRSTCYPL